MTEVSRPAVRPARPFFSSGPCAKRPGWTPEALKGALVGRSHRSKPGKSKLKDAIERTKTLLGLPAGYRLGIVPASDTGAVEMALWSLLGARPVDLFAWESFSEDWVTDTVKQLKLKDARVFKAAYGELPDLSQYNPAHDAVFVWNGTTSGVKVPNGDWIPANREGLTICDATSAAFAMDLPWDKLDVVTFSWQKVLGGEGAHGMLILSPRAVERLESYKPAWPLPKIFRLTSGGKLIEGIFKGETINTPSMLCVEDYLDALDWARSIGVLDALIARADANFAAVDAFVAASSWLGHLAVERLESHTPAWPLPKIFRMTKGGKLIEGIFKGETINTPSMLAIEDYIYSLEWAKSLGGLKALINRADANAAAVDAFVQKTPWIQHLATDPASRSNTSVCLSFAPDAVQGLDEEAQLALVKKIASLLEVEEAAYDIAGYRDAPPGLRIWCGGTVETADIEALGPWLDWAWSQARS